MKHILLTITLIFGATSVNAAERETWLCDGFLYTDKSKGNPFIMYGDGKRYEWTDVENDHEYEIEYVGKGWGPNHDLYIERRNGFNRPYFIQTSNHPIQKGKWKKNKLMIINFYVPLNFDQLEIDTFHSVTTCIRQ